MTGINKPGESNAYIDEIETCDQDNLLKSSVIRGEEPMDEKSEPVLHQPRGSTRLITVEPAVIGSMFLLSLYSILAKEYFYHRIAADYNLTEINTTGSSCEGLKQNESDPDYELRQKVSAETAALSLYLDISSEHNK